MSGSVYVPAGAPPPGGWPIESIGHPTTGLSDCTAPSKFGFSGGSGVGGTVEVRTDYEGLGTPGEHAYLVGEALGHNMLDIARAARQLPGVQAGNQVVLRGYSEGGHAALFGGEHAGSYAPELDVVGVVAAAPAVELAELLKTSARTSERPRLRGMRRLGLLARATSSSLEDVMTPAAIDSVTNMAHCDRDPPNGASGASPPTRRSSRLPGRFPPGAGTSTRTHPGTGGPCPTWIFAGGQDPVVPLPAIEGYVDRACEQGTHVTLFVYPQGGHTGITDGDLIDQWVDARRAGEPLGESTCDTDERPPPPYQPPGEEERQPPVVSAAQPATPTPGTPTFTG